MASIKNRNGSYLITVSLGRDVNGKQILETTTFKPSATTPKAIEKEVDAYAREFEERVKNGKFLKGEKITFCDFLPRWREDYAQDNLSLSVTENYEQLLRDYIIPSIGNMKLAKINALHINSIYSGMKAKGKAQGTIGKVHSLLSGIFSRAYKWGIIDENVCKRVDAPSTTPQGDIQCFTLEQANTFLNVALKKGYETTYTAHTRIDDTGKAYNVSEYKETRHTPLKYQVFYYIALFGGFRRGEIIALTWNDIDYENNTISINKATSKTKSKGQIQKDPKTKAGNREIILPQVCFDMLKSLYLQQKEHALQMANLWVGYRGKQFDDNFIFIQDNGKQMDISTPAKKFKKIIENYNATCETEEEKLPLIRLHDLRNHNFSEIRTFWEITPKYAIPQI